jgi:hypothetical protein
MMKDNIVDIVAVFSPSDNVYNDDDGLQVMILLDHFRGGWLPSKEWSQNEYFLSWGSDSNSP